MSEEEDIFQLPVDPAPKTLGRTARLDSIKKQRDELPFGLQRKSKESLLRTIDEPPENPIEEEPTVVLGNEKKRHAFEGKSVDYTIDEIINTKTAVVDTSEKDWGAIGKTMPMGWIISLSALALTLILFVIYLASTSGQKEVEIVQSQQFQATDQSGKTDEASELVQTIDQTVRQYLAATSIEEKLRFVRHAEAMRPRMEKYYAIHPIESFECRLITNLKPITLNGRAFWQMIAVTGQTSGQPILLEQLSDKEVKIDWESQVHYQPMPWEQYAVELPNQSMAFRLSIKESPRYFGEFSDQNRWASYQLNARGSETVLYGYVLRDSPAHLSIQQAMQRGFTRMILRLQASKSIQLPNAVVIESFVSADLYRIDPPKSIYD